MKLVHAIIRETTSLIRSGSRAFKYENVTFIGGTLDGETLPFPRSMQVRITFIGGTLDGETLPFPRSMQVRTWIQPHSNGEDWYQRSKRRLFTGPLFELVEPGRRRYELRTGGHFGPGGIPTKLEPGEGVILSGGRMATEGEVDEATRNI